MGEPHFLYMKHLFKQLSTDETFRDQFTALIPQDTPLIAVGEDEYREDAMKRFGGNKAFNSCPVVFSLVNDEVTVLGVGRSLADMVEGKSFGESILSPIEAPNQQA